MADKLTPAVIGMILRWLGPGRDRDSVEQVAQWMARSLRLGDIGTCRNIVWEAIRCERK